MNTELLMVLVGLLPAIISVIVGRRAQEPRKLIASAVPKLWLAFLFLAMALPRADLAARAAFVVAVLLAVLDTWIDVRKFRRDRKVATHR